MPPKIDKHTRYIEINIFNSSFRFYYINYIRIKAVKKNVYKNYITTYNNIRYFLYKFFTSYDTIKSTNY